MYKSKNMLFIVVMTLLFIITPFYSQHNGGGSGLALPYNISVWLVASWIMALGTLLFIKSKYFSYPRGWLYLIIFPVIVILSSISAEINQPIAWLFRQLYILGGLIFLFSLFQFNAKQRSLDLLLVILIIAIGLHALLGVIQIHFPASISEWFPTNRRFIPSGVFQQINVQAILLVTGLIISLYLISRPSFRYSAMITKLIVIISFSLSFYVIIASGSRAALLSMLVSIPLVLGSRFRQLRYHKVLLAVLLIASCAGFIAGQAGLDKTMDKTAQLTEKSYSDARVVMYTVGMELVAKNPIHGYGIGGFLRAWNTQVSDFVSRHPETGMPDYVTHPHNEILFWMIEGGLSVLIGILIFIIGISLALYQCGFQRGGAYAAMLFPISFHTQVELPFYISSLHWFLWLFLIYLVLRHQTNTRSVTLSYAMTRLIQTVAIVFAIGMTLFMINTARAQEDLHRYLYNLNPQTPYLHVAMNNLYFKPAAEQAAMHTMLFDSIDNNKQEKVEEFELWAQNYVTTNPTLDMYSDLIAASKFLRPEGKGCDAISAGIAMYAPNKALQQAFKRCNGIIINGVRVRLLPEIHQYR